jgi:alkaline phosphatase D
VGESGGITRRQFLGATAAAGIAVAASGSVASASTRISRGPLLVRAGPKFAAPPFTLGVASGDPLPNAVVLWTRLAPEPQAPLGGLASAPVPVRWELANDERFRKVVAKGKATARPEHAFSVHIDAKGLDPAHDYFYRFIAAGEQSPVGRTRTAPADDAAAKRLRFAFSSCQNYQDGYFSPYAHMAEEDVDFVAFLGDYIYENGPNQNAVRQHEGPEVMDLDAYRARYATYKADQQLQAAHAAFPWIVTWDDHEVDNNYANDQADDEVLPPDRFLERRAAAYKVWWEHQPVRLAPPDGPDLKIYRTLAFGQLAQFSVLDTRQYRTNQPCRTLLDVGLACDDVDATSATLLGEAQERWLARGLRRSRARWNVLAQQVMVGKVNFTPGGDPPAYNFDQWDGYGSAQQRLSETLLEESPGNAVIITGDIHSSWAHDLKARPGDEASQNVGTEFVGTSITSSMDFDSFVRGAIAGNPTVKYYEGAHHGYVVCDVTKKEWRTDFRYVSTVDSPDATIETGNSFAVEHGKPGAVEA